MSIPSRETHILGTLVGDIVHEPNARIKYGYFFEAIKRRFPLVGIYNANLSGLDRFAVALSAIHPNWRHWREKFYKNVPAFRIRSRRVTAHLNSLPGRVDVILQLGVLFDVKEDEISCPSIIYTDYTATLAAQKPELGRSPFTSRQREEWIALERQAFKRAAHICTRSHLVRNSILTDYGILPERVTVIGGGANFASLPKRISKGNDGTFTVLFIGKEFYRKGGDILLRAFAQVHSQFPQARLIMVTGDPIPANLPLNDVEVISPTWDREAIKRLYQCADVFVLPSRLETWGDVLLEAMAYEIPCIGVTGEAMQEIIEDGRTGLLVPPKNVELLADALIQLLSDFSLRRGCGRAARRQLEVKYTWDRVVDRLSPIIEATTKS